MPAIELTSPYSIELANVKPITSHQIIRDCPLILNDHQFLIDLLPVELGSFDIVVEMDWLSKYKAEIICEQKMGEKSGTILNLISHLKVLKGIHQGCDVFLASVMTTEPEEQRIKDIPIVCDYPDVFPDELPGLPPNRQVEFRIDLIPGAAPIAKAPYCLAPSEMR
ncbi:uncharacterized protein LOC110900480 [Helianthus annuus]|uniref:uncharacterized protein LOC110900480 n=1 Tax=Helianthus annuus TaxID=4232 RepID=UPI000B90951E|nr:uncharacterized protein LOC110900480 [Helianthus annuus]